MAASSSCTFLTAVERVISAWEALKVAVENGMGGPQALEKVKWLTEVISDFFCNETDRIYPDEVEDFIADILNNEFDTRVEDGSLSLIAQTLCKLFEIYSNDSKEKFEAEVAALPNLSLGGWKWNSVRMEEDEEENDDILNDEQVKQLVPQMENIQIEVKSEQEEDGWTVVNKNRRR